MIENRILDLVKKHKKFRYKVKYICGDPYYEEMTYEEAAEKIVLRPKDEEHMLKSQQECDHWIADNISAKMPIDGPLTRIYV